jgi:hypothetical protein
MKWLRRKKSPPPRNPLPGWPGGDERDSLADDLKRHVYEAMYAVHPRERQTAHWVMSSDWKDELLKISDRAGPLWTPNLDNGEPIYLLGKRVEIRDGAGPPHLEPHEAG